MSVQHLLLLTVAISMILLSSALSNSQLTTVDSTCNATELRSQLTKIQAALNEQARLFRSVLSGDSDYFYRFGTLAYGTRGHPAKSCADLLRQRKHTVSGYYWVKPLQGNAVYNVYCDMTHFGGGWTLVVGINARTNQHLTYGAVGEKCVEGYLCVAHRTSGVIPARKLDDRVIRSLADDEGYHTVKHQSLSALTTTDIINCFSWFNRLSVVCTFGSGTFRIDVGPNEYTTFYQIPGGASTFQSHCGGTSCARMIISHYYPYKWESNCRGLTIGYRVYSSNHKVFDSYDDKECNGSRWSSALASANRVLYGHSGSTGVFNRQQGFMYVR